MKIVSNHYYGKVEQYTDIPAAHLGGQIALGQGVNMNEPDNLVVKSARPFEALSSNDLMLSQQPYNSDDIVITNAAVKMSQSEVEEARIISEHFSASYGVFNANQSLIQACKLQSSFYTLYLLLEIRGETIPRAGDHQLDTRWQEKPLSENISDKDECYNDFSHRYGTHYLSRKQYGLRLGIQAKVNKNNLIDKTTFEADVGAALKGFTAKAGISIDDKKTLQEKHVELLFSCTGGIHYKDGRKYLGVSSNEEDINKFMIDLASGEILIDSVPISYTLDSYWTTLDLEWGHAREALSPTEEFTPLPAPYGVPRGTILPWLPPTTAIRNLEKPADPFPAEVVVVVVAEVQVPDGWAICDGSNRTPNLLNKFIRGASDLLHASELGGSEKHTHTVTLGKSSNNHSESGGMGASTNLAEGRHIHTATAGDAEHLPPYVSLLYIMKL